MSSKTYTDEFKKQIAIRIQKGETMLSLSKETGVSMGALSSWRTQFKLKKLDLKNSTITSVSHIDNEISSLTLNIKESELKLEYLEKLKKLKATAE